MPTPILLQTPAPIPRWPWRLVAPAASLPVSCRPAPLQWTDCATVLDKREPQEIHQGDGETECAILDPHILGLVMRQCRWDGHSERAAGARVPVATRVEFDHKIPFQERKVVDGA